MTKIERLEFELEAVRQSRDYERRQAEFWRKRYELVVKAWSWVHPADLAYMRSMEGKTEILDIYNELIYDFGRPQADGTVRTRLETASAISAALWIAEHR